MQHIYERIHFIFCLNTEHNVRLYGCTRERWPIHAYIRPEMKLESEREKERESERKRSETKMANKCISNGGEVAFELDVWAHRKKAKIKSK